MQTIDHDNIVRMYGVVLDKDNSLMLVSALTIKNLKNLYTVIKVLEEGNASKKVADRIQSSVVPDQNATKGAV